MEQDPAFTISFEAQPLLTLAIVQRGFLGEVFAAEIGGKNATPELFDEIEDTARQDLGALYALDPDFFGFICRRCAAAYCRGCWRNVYPVFDEGLYDQTRGICPRGHEQMLQD